MTVKELREELDRVDRDDVPVRLVIKAVKTEDLKDGDYVFGNLKDVQPIGDTVYIGADFEVSW